MYFYHSVLADMMKYIYHKWATTIAFLANLLRDVIHFGSIYIGLKQETCNSLQGCKRMKQRLLRVNGAKNRSCKIYKRMYFESRRCFQPFEINEINGGINGAAM